MARADDRAAPMLSSDIPEIPDFFLEESDLASEFRARATKALALAARSAHLAVLHPTHTSLRGKEDGRQIPTTGRVTLTEADPSHRVTLHPIQAAHSRTLSEAGYVSLQRHGAGCRSDELVAINAFAWADLEIREGHEFFGVDPEEVAGIVIARHEAAGVPRPSYVTFSGRGLWFVYLADGHIPPQARGRVLKAVRAYWGEEIRTGRGAGTDRVVARAAAMKALWQGGELDWSVADMSRVHRIAGSVNDKSGETVRLVWPASWADVERSSFDDFADAVLPFSREETQAYLSDRAAAREARQARAAAEGRPGRRFARGPRPARWAAVAGEIEALIRHHAGDGAVSPELGLRNLLAHHLCCAWALSGRGGDARTWAAELAPRLCGPKLSVRALTTYLRPIEKALRRHEAGETEWYTPPGGEPREVSPLYEYGIGRVARELRVTAELASELGFRILTPAAEARQALTAAERQAARRARLGAQRKADMERAAQERLERILALTEEGLEADEIADRLGCCVKTVERAYEKMFEGAADNVVVEFDQADEDVSDAQMQELVEACTRTDASRYLSEGYALQGSPASALAPVADHSAQISLAVVPYAAEFLARAGVVQGHKPLPLPTDAELVAWVMAASQDAPANAQAWDPVDRLAVLYRHWLAAYEGCPMSVEDEAFVVALGILGKELITGRRDTSYGLKKNDIRKRGSRHHYDDACPDLGYRLH